MLLSINCAIALCVVYTNVHTLIKTYFIAKKCLPSPSASCSSNIKDHYHGSPEQIQ